jgi:flavorubredoxin
MTKVAVVEESGANMKMAKKLSIIYGTGFQNAGLMAKAIAEGAMNEGIDVILKTVDEVSPGDVENVDAIAIGLATYEDSMKFVESLAKVPLKGKVGAAFGAYGWSGEGPVVVTKILSSYGMNVIDPPLSIERIPDEEALDTCRNFGKSIAEYIKLQEER